MTMKKKSVNKKYSDAVLEKIVSSIVSSVAPDKIILFGSRAMGRHRKDSDYDICVLKRNIRNRSRFVGKIYRRLGVMASVDVVVNTPVRFQQLKDKWFFVYHDIDKFGKVIYEK